MNYSVKISSTLQNEIEKFLNLFFGKNFELSDKFNWQKNFGSPIDFIDIISTFIDNKEKFNANIWISLDKDTYICVTENNINDLIKYIYERFPY